ncbi:MAG: nucleotidyltransferase family protein [Terriglobales bacterium]
MRRDLQVVILAGGLGTRLRPITERVPKPMVPVGGQPFLQYILEHLVAQGFARSLLLLGYLGEQVYDYFGDGSRFGLALEYAQEHQPLGTAGAVRNAFDQLEEEFVLLYGDSFLPIDYREVVDAFYEKPCEGLVIGYDNQHSDTGVKHNLAIDSSGYVMRYDKSGVGADLTLVEAGVLCFRRDVFAALPPGQAISLEQEIFPELIARRQLRAFITPQRFYDIGTFERLQEFAAIKA